MFRTKRQRDDLCRDCPIARVADIAGDSCSLLIIRDLLKEPMRFTDLMGTLKGASSRTLTKKLKALEEAGILTRSSDAKNPTGVHYRLTKKGVALDPVLNAMREYGDKYL